MAEECIENYAPELVVKYLANIPDQLTNALPGSSMESAPGSLSALMDSQRTVSRRRSNIKLDNTLIETTESFDPLDHPIRTVVLFADISGFTALSERLAQRGPSGAEELGFYLNRYFERMIKFVGRSGGDVFKFAGDAMLVLWPEEYKEYKEYKEEGTEEDIVDLAKMGRRAAQCALDIQNELIQANLAEGVTLSVKLGMSLGDAT